jgi:DNA-binding NtrC family response regulator
MLAPDDQTAFALGPAPRRPTNEIFVVDDDEDMQSLLAAALASEGYSITKFGSADSLLAATNSRVPICIFLDMVMPKRSGLETLKELRARNYWTPIFMVTGASDLATAVEAMKCGAQDYITKPFDPDTTALRVRKAVELWVDREWSSRPSDFPAIDDAEWLRVTPKEKEMLMLMRFMEIAPER